MLTLAHIFISFCDCLQCDRQWCGQGTEVLNAPLESNCWTLAEHTFFQLPDYTVFNTGRLAGWVVTG